MGGAPPVSSMQRQAWLFKPLPNAHRSLLIKSQQETGSNQKQAQILA